MNRQALDDKLEELAAAIEALAARIVPADFTPEVTTVQAEIDRVNALAPAA